MEALINTICIAWVDKNPELLRTILAPNFEWYDNAFMEPISTADDLIAMWNRDISEQQNIVADCKILVQSENKATAQWKASYYINNIKVELEGIMYIETTQDSKLSMLKQWWVKN